MHLQLPNRGFNLPPAATLAHHPPHPLICATCDITVVMKKLLKIQQC